MAWEVVGQQVIFGVVQGAPFEDEWKLELTHEGRGILSMANKGPNTNTSQLYVMSFHLGACLPNNAAHATHLRCSFITFRSCKHLDKKHTIFGRVVGGMDTLTNMERVKTDEDDKPLEDIVIEKVTVFVNPFAEVDAQKAEEDKARREAQAKEKAQAVQQPKEVKPVKSGVGRYIGTTQPSDATKRAMQDDDHAEAKKKKTAHKGFGDFSSW